MTEAKPSGLVIVDKGPGVTSHDVVSRVRRLAGTRKVGHAGTLDPMATGVLVVGVERATRLLGHLMLTEKAYDATVRLGIATHTDDAEGGVVATAEPGAVEALSEAEIRAAFATQVGEIEQVPTTVSAIKVDGKRAYALAREGAAVELKARPVTIHELTVGGLRGVGTGSLEADISVRCSSGTYIRAIARDVGAILGVGGHLTALRRTAVGPYTLAQAATLEELGEAQAGGRSLLLPIGAAARAAFPSYDLDEEQEREVRHGRRIALAVDGLTAVFALDGEFLALYEPVPGTPLARPVAVFVG
ncbi:MAG: tRNA pseudouridine(55) synthase TruB [Nocardioides sp.]|uniref:tRNA pseudouridine(55) synthase TruB n=1 Tax=Nocardioides sp. TaxID=35761 RepID=UPI0039E606E5